jgi:branched-chain amino acid transport system ATP-binding protein
MMSPETQSREAQTSEVHLPLLRISALTKKFGGFTALDNVSVDIRPGERFGLIGPNGSGKTTLINCISGAFRTEPGSVMFRDEDITRLPPHIRTRRGIARSFQIPRPFKSMTVAENLMVGLDFAGRAGESVSTGQRRDTLMSILTRMGLASKADVSTAKLSQVELRKMELARALATHPKLLISDEAMAGLSNSEVDEVLDLLMSLADQDITIIMIEHIMQAVMRFSDRVMCLEAGRIIAIGKPAEVMANQRVQEAYLGT